MEQEEIIHSRKYTNQAVLMRTIGTGAFIGLSFYFFWTMITTFHFTPYPIHYYIQSSMSLMFDVPKWFEIILIASTISILSIIVALIYYIIAKNWISIWIGIIYGMIIASIHIFIIHPLFVGETLLFHSYGSTVSIISMHVLYGLSIGYSISFDYTESLAHRNAIKQNEKKM